MDELFTAARAQCGHAMAKLARKLQPKNTWKELVLPKDVVGQLREFCARLKWSEHIFSTWGFERKLSHGKGTTALFVGPPGTGKTMAAEVIANEIKLDVYKIDLSGIVSKYIGETQKNLDRIFSAAEEANGVLFFDEADMLFGKRSEVRDSHDRYANSEVSYLLQKMEMYEGAAILATNLSQHMDEAFLRRFAFTIRFPFPEEDCRRQIWKSIWPEHAPLDEEINFDHLASRFRLSGGNIKNVALAAAFFAAEEGGPVTMAHLFRGIEREYQKMGKSMSAAALRSELEEARLQ
jgi:SpoVK/Ycf46/Vps4 family AAA+-type ATPase